jgi:very-short-patch-repair endonuclease
MDKRNKPWNKNLTKYTDERIRNASIKDSKNRKGKCMGDKNPAKRLEVRKKISLKLKNRIITKVWKEKISRTLKGRSHSEETKRKMSLARKGKISPRKGILHTNETKTKMRISAFEYAKQKASIICPRIGKNEKNILDKLEKKTKYSIDRNFKVLGYFPDGYVHELNLIIEVDERPKISKKDIEREEDIKKELGCEFLRIKDYV